MIAGIHPALPQVDEVPLGLRFARAAQVLGRTLDVSRAGYGTVDPRSETITTERAYCADGIAPLPPVLNFRDYGSYIDDLKAGVTVAIADVRDDPRTRDTAEGLRELSAMSFINMPVTEQGGFVALLYLNNATPRPWSDEDVAFVRDAAERAFRRVGGVNGGLSSAFTKLAKQYFNESESLIAYPFDDLNNVWSYGFVGLEPTPVPTTIFAEIMAMRMASKARLPPVVRLRTSSALLRSTWKRSGR